MFLRHTTVVALTLAAALFISVSGGTGTSAMATEPDCATSTATGGTAAALACWTPVTESNLSPASQSRAIAIAKKHNQAQGVGIKHDPMPTLLVSSNEAVAVAWTLSGANVLSPSRLVVIVSPGGRTHSIEQDDFIATADGGIVHQYWQDKKLKATASYTATEISQDAAQEQLELGIQARHANVAVSGAQTAHWDVTTCTIAMASILLLSMGASATCIFAPWACFGAWAVVAGLIYQVVMNCS